MSNLVPHAAPLPPIERLHALYQQLERIDTAEDVAAFADDARILRAAIDAADHGIDIRNEAAELHLRAERKLGTLLEGVVKRGNRHTGSTIPEGINQQRAHRARQLASVPGDAFDEFIAHNKQNRREISQRGALQLLPRTQREDRSNIAAVYTAPPVDTEIARAIGLEASDDRAQLIVDAINEALATMDNPRHAFVWAKHHGINDDGTLGESWTYAGIAQAMGVSREYVENLYYRASHHVRGYIAVAALDRVAMIQHAA